MISTDEKKAIISDFLVRCNEYAEAQLMKYQARLDGDDTRSMDALAIEATIYNWKVYRAFNAYTIEELKTDELDSWFE